MNLFIKTQSTHPTQYRLIFNLLLLSFIKYKLYKILAIKYLATVIIFIHELQHRLP